MVARPSATASPNDRPLLVFISYSHRDGEFRERLEVHLAQLKRDGVDTWFDGDMLAGDELDPTIRRKLGQADIFVALASPDYLHSPYCYDREYQFALRKARRKKIHVVVAIARRCSWRHTRMGRYLAVPKDGKAIEDFSRRTRAYEQIVEALRSIVKRVRAESSRQAAPAGLARQSAVPKARKTASAKPAPKKAGAGTDGARPAKARMKDPSTRSAKRIAAPPASPGSRSRRRPRQP